MLSFLIYHHRREFDSIVSCNAFVRNFLSQFWRFVVHLHTYFLFPFFTFRVPDIRTKRDSAQRALARHARWTCDPFKVSPCVRSFVRLANQLPELCSWSLPPRATRVLCRLCCCVYIVVRGSLIDPRLSCRTHSRAVRRIVDGLERVG